MSRISVLVGGVLLGFGVASLIGPLDMPLGWRFWKMTASTGFVLVAIGAGGLRTGPGRTVVAALVCCWVGDLALTFDGELWFRRGLVAFLLGHLFLIAAFAWYGLSAKPCIVAATFLIPLDAGLLVWLFPHVPTSLRWFVAAYVVAISAMVVTAAGAWGRRGARLALSGAILFFVSDVFVARGAFLESGFPNHLFGVPTYYGGVLLLALAAGRFHSPEPDTTPEL